MSWLKNTSQGGWWQPWQATGKCGDRSAACTTRNRVSRFQCRQREKGSLPGRGEPKVCDSTLRLPSLCFRLRAEICARAPPRLWPVVMTEAVGFLAMRPTTFSLICFWKLELQSWQNICTTWHSSPHSWQFTVRRLQPVTNSSKSVEPLKVSRIWLASALYPMNTAAIDSPFHMKLTFCRLRPAASPHDQAAMQARGQQARREQRAYIADSGMLKATPSLRVKPAARVRSAARRRGVVVGLTIIQFLLDSDEGYSQQGANGAGLDPCSKQGGSYVIVG